MRVRHTGNRTAGRAGLRWLAGGVAVTIAGAIALATAASSSAGTTTVHAELSFSGIATNANILGGSQIGVHPGDTVVFSPSTIPTAGLANIPAAGDALDSLLQTILGSVTGYQVTVHFPASFPGGKRDVVLGACSPTKSVTVTFPTKGNYGFTWSATAISPLCLLPASIGDLAGNQLKSAGIALNASNQWVGNIAVADNAVDGGISIQLPGVSIAPSLPGIGQLPTIGVPNLNLPTIPVSVPGLTKGLPGSGGSGGASGSGSSAPSSFDYTPPPTTVPQMVVPHPVDGGGGLDGGFGGALPSTSTSSQASSSTPSDGSSVASSAVPSSPSSSKPVKQIQLASSSNNSSAQIPVVLTIIAVIALTLVTATYARLYLIRRSV